MRDTVSFWTRRHFAKPGLTGWAQARRGYTVLDLAVCAKTFSTLVSRSGAR